MEWKEEGCESVGESEYIYIGSMVMEEGNGGRGM